MMKAGMNPTQIGRRLGVARLTVYRWKSRGRGKRAQIRPAGRKPEMTTRQIRALQGILERGAVAYGFATEMWTGRRIAQVIGERFGVSYHFKSIPALLHSAGWSWQKPGKRAKERDEAAVRCWVRERWPHIKKRREKGRDHCLRGRERVLSGPASAAHLGPARADTSASPPVQLEETLGHQRRDAG